jgi:ribonuclease HI
MGWRRGEFGGKPVWVSVDDAGKPRVLGGRVPIRYAPTEGARIYRGSVGLIDLHPSGEIEELPTGIAADKAEAAAKAERATKRGSGFGSAGTRTAGQAAMAAEAARELITGLPPETVVVFTDGSCKGNPGPAGSGAVMELPDGRRGEWARSLGRGTNNVAELTAIEMALDMLDRAEVAPEAPVSIFTDSGYAHGVLCKAWKAKANVALITNLRARLKLRPGVTIRWIAGHVGVAGNERADALANRGVEGRTEVLWTEHR